MNVFGVYLRATNIILNGFKLTVRVSQLCLESSSSWGRVIRQLSGIIHHDDSAGHSRLDLVAAQGSGSVAGDEQLEAGS